MLSFFPGQKGMISNIRKKESDAYEKINTEVKQYGMEHFSQPFIPGDVIYAISHKYILSIRIPVNELDQDTRKKVLSEISKKTAKLSPAKFVKEENDEFIFDWFPTGLTEKEKNLCIDFIYKLL